MLKNKKGFTLIEILAAITILGILTTIAVVSVTKIIENGKKQHYTTAEENLSLAGQSYVQQNRKDLPKAIGQKKKINLKTLIDKKYIQPIKDYSENECDLTKSYVQVYKYTQSDYSYVAYLDCPGYNSKETINNLTPEITASIVVDEEKSTATAPVKITGNDKIMSYSYIVYRNGKEVKNTGSVMVTDFKSSLEFTIKLTDYTPGKIKIIITATNTYGNVKNKTLSQDIRDTKPPKCIIKEEDEISSPKEWINTNRKITVGCDDGDGSGCVREQFTKTFKQTTQNGIIKIQDASGNETECNVSVYIDKEKPSCTNNGDSTTWINTNRTISWGCSDSKSGCNPNYSGGSQTFSTTIREYTIPSYTIQDKAGNETTCQQRTASVYVDKTAPMCTNSGDSKNWTKNNRTINYGCQDADSGCHNSHKGGSITIDKTTETKTIATYTIKDIAGNETTCAARTANVYVDKTEPTCTNSGDSTTWTSGDRTISYGCSDTNSGCKKGKTGGSVTVNNTTTTKLIDSYTIEDNAGNKKTCPARTANVYVDKTAPTCTNSGDSTSWTSGNRTINYGCSDSHSGCHASYSGGSTTYSWTQGQATIAGYTIYDNVWNSTWCPERTANVYVDKTAPNAPSVALVKGDWVELPNNTWQPYAFYTSGSTNSSSPYPSTTDTGSGVGKYQISPDNSTWYDWNYWDTTSYSNKLYRNYPDGITYRYVRAVDKVGNVSTPTIKTIAQDTTAPTCGTVTGASTSWTTSNRTISVACSDATSGCKQATYSATYSSGKTQTANIRIYDNAGNYRDCGVNVYVDKTTPQVTVSGNMNNWVTYENKECSWYGRAKWNGTVCKNSGGHCDNTAGKVETSISGNVVTFNWYVANGAESYIGGSYWVKFIIKNSAGTEIYSTYLKEGYNPNSWGKGGNFSGSLSYTFNDVGTYYVYMDGNTTSSPRYDWTMGTITVTKG